jgi:hypothetical protein
LLFIRLGPASYFFKVSAVFFSLGRPLDSSIFCGLFQRLPKLATLGQRQAFSEKSTKIEARPNRSKTTAETL